MNIRKLNRLDALVEKQRDKGALLGATMIVEHKGKRVYEKYDKTCHSSGSNDAL